MPRFGSHARRHSRRQGSLPRSSGCDGTSERSQGQLVASWIPIGSSRRRFSLQHLVHTPAVRSTQRSEGFHQLQLHSRFDVHVHPQGQGADLHRSRRRRSHRHLGWRNPDRTRTRIEVPQQHACFAQLQLGQSAVARRSHRYFCRSQLRHSSRREELQDEHGQGSFFFLSLFLDRFPRRVSSFLSSSLCLPLYQLADALHSLPLPSHRSAKSISLRSTTSDERTSNPNRLPSSLRRLSTRSPRRSDSPRTNRFSFERPLVWTR